MPPRWQYLHYGQPWKPPVDPVTGAILPFTPARLSDANPAFVELKKGLLDRSINPHSAPHKAYNANPAFYRTAPGKWPRFWRQTILKVLKIDLGPEIEQEQVSTASQASDDGSTLRSHFASTASSLPSTTSSPLPTTNEDDASFASTRRDPTGNRDLAGPALFGPDGMAIHVEELAEYDESSPHFVGRLEYQRDETRTGCRVRVVPQAGMNSSNTTFRKSTIDPRVIIMEHQKGARANPAAVERAMTDGTHEIEYKHEGQIVSEPLELHPKDGTVGEVVDTTRRIHGQTANGHKTASYVQGFRFPRPIKARLQAADATTTRLPRKYMIQPRSEVEDGITYLVFNVEYEDSDADALNFDSDDDGGGGGGGGGIFFSWLAQSRRGFST